MQSREAKRLECENEQFWRIERIAEEERILERDNIERDNGWDFSKTDETKQIWETH